MASNEKAKIHPSGMCYGDIRLPKPLAIEICEAKGTL